MELSQNVKELDGVTVEGNGITRKIDRMLVYPTKDAVKHSYDPIDLISYMAIPRLRANKTNQTIESDNGSIQLRINGIPASQAEYLAIPAKDVIRIEVIDNPGLRYGSVGMVVDLIVKRRPTGGIMNMNWGLTPLNLRFQQPYIGMKLNHAKSQFGFYYDGSTWYSKETRTDIDETFCLGDKTIHRIQEGINDKRVMGSHAFTLTYNLYSLDSYNLNIAFKNTFSNNPHEGNSNKLYNALFPEDFTYSKIKRSSRSYTPSLDVFFRKQFKHEQDIQINVVGTLIKTKSNRNYTEQRADGTELAQLWTDIDADKKSVWGEAIYGKVFKKVVLSIGTRHYQMYANNVYTGNNYPTVSSMHQMNSSAFFDLQGNIKKMGYLLSLGSTRSYFREGTEKHKYYIFTPTFRLNMTPHKGGWLQYQFSISSNIPSLSSLTDVEQQVDTIQIQRGNPRLKMYKLYDNQLMYVYRTKIFGILAMLQYQYYDNPIMDEFYVEYNKIIRTEANQINAQYITFFTNFQLFDVKIGENWVWDLSIVPVFSRNWTKGENYKHVFDSFKLISSGNLFYKDFGLFFNIEQFGGRLWGETITKNDNRFGIGLKYRNKKLQFNIGIDYPFGKYKYGGTDRVSSVISTKAWCYDGIEEKAIWFRLRYRFEFGNKFKERNRETKHNDNDAGTLEL